MRTHTLSLERMQQTGKDGEGGNLCSPHFRAKGMIVSERLLSTGDHLAPQASLELVSCTRAMLAHFFFFWPPPPLPPPRVLFSCPPELRRTVSLSVCVPSSPSGFCLTLGQEVGVLEACVGVLLLHTPMPGEIPHQQVSGGHRPWTAHACPAGHQYPRISLALHLLACASAQHTVSDRPLV